MNEIQEHNRKGWKDLDYSLEFGESNRRGQKRFIAALHSIVNQESVEGPNRSVGVCTHNNVIALAEHAATGSFGFTGLKYCEFRRLILRPDGGQLLNSRSNGPG